MSHELHLSKLIVGEEELCDRATVSLVGFVCVNAHVFFVLDRDVAKMVDATAA
jgi:hypothetical protein